MSINYYKVGAQQGWQCPLCGKIYGPFVQECYSCNNTNITNITNTMGELTTAEAELDAVTNSLHKPEITD